MFAVLLQMSRKALTELEVNHAFEDLYGLPEDPFFLILNKQKAKVLFLFLPS